MGTKQELLAVSGTKAAAFQEDIEFMMGLVAGAHSLTNDDDTAQARVYRAIGGYMENDRPRRRNQLVQSAFAKANEAAGRISPIELDEQSQAVQNGHCGA